MPLNKPDILRSERSITYFNDIESRLIESGNLLKESDAHAIAMLANNLVDYDENSKLLAEEGILIKSESHNGKTITKKNIRSDFLKDIQANIRFYVNQLSMSPKSRGAKNTNGGGKVDDGFDEFL